MTEGVSSYINPTTKETRVRHSMIQARYTIERLRPYSIACLAIPVAYLLVDVLFSRDLIDHEFVKVMLLVA